MYYKSTDETTGGFNEFSLYLHSNGKFELSLKTMTSSENKEAETIWTPKEKSIKGKWDVKNNKIEYSLDVSPSVFDSLFIYSSFDFKNKKVLSFSQSLDTAFIFGIPCMRTKPK